MILKSENFAHECYRNFVVREMPAAFIILRCLSLFYLPIIAVAVASHNWIIGEKFAK